MKTRDECRSLSENSSSFYVKEIIVNGFNVEIYNYRMATYDDFLNNNAFELRGLTFVQDNFGNYERFLSINKFFNLNEVPEWNYDILIHKDILHVQEKLDGSLISFVRFPDGSIMAKSKMSFESIQAQMAQEIINTSPELYSFVKDMIDSRRYPLFELTSYLNQVVVPVSYTHLTLPTTPYV